MFPEDWFGKWQKMLFGKCPRGIWQNEHIQKNLAIEAENQANLRAKQQNICLRES